MELWECMVLLWGSWILAIFQSYTIKGIEGLFGYTIWLIIIAIIFNDLYRDKKHNKSRGGGE